MWPLLRATLGHGGALTNSKAKMRWKRFITTRRDAGFDEALKREVFWSVIHLTSLVALRYASRPLQNARGQRQQTMPATSVVTSNNLRKPRTYEARSRPHKITCWKKHSGS